MTSSAEVGWSARRGVAVEMPGAEVGREREEEDQSHPGLISRAGRVSGKRR